MGRSMTKGRRTPIGGEEPINTGVLILGTIAVLGTAAAILWFVGSTTLDLAQEAFGAKDVEIGQHAGWMGAPLAFLIAMVGIKAAWSVLSWIFWRPKHGPDWEQPDSELSPAQITERRELEREWRIDHPHHDRHPLLRASTWGSIALFGLVVAAPAFMEASLMADSPKPTYMDAREGMLRIGEKCPALADDVASAIARGVPTGQEVVSMRMRAKVISASLLPGQECSL